MTHTAVLTSLIFPLRYKHSTCCRYCECTMAMISSSTRSHAPRQHLANASCRSPPPVNPWTQPGTHSCERANRRAESTVAAATPAPPDRKRAPASSSRNDSAPRSRDTARVSPLSSEYSPPSSGGSPRTSTSAGSSVLFRLDRDFSHAKVRAADWYAAASDSSPRSIIPSSPSSASSPSPSSSSVSSGGSSGSSVSFFSSD